MIVFHSFSSILHHIFSFILKVNFRLDAYNRKSDILNAIAYLPQSGGRTNTAAGINTMRSDVFTKTGDRAGIKNVAILLSDGNTNVNPQNVCKYLLGVLCFFSISILLYPGVSYEIKQHFSFYMY